MSLLFITVAPSITFVTEDINAQRNTMHELNCTAEGGPYNMFSWKELDTNETLTYSSELTITVDSATVGGVYQCTVENMAGSDSANTTINGRATIYHIIHTLSILYHSCSGILPASRR